jgi:NADH:ubiquinone oxidoreductase subunit
MGILANAFTWWNGASWGTSIVTRMHGEEVGQDEAGNVYFRHRKDPARRWVIYKGSNDSSNVPPGWNAWLRGTIDEVPSKSLPERRPFEIAPQPNLTGSEEAWRPSGSMKGQARRPLATGDYTAWTPDT